MKKFIVKAIIFLGIVTGSVGGIILISAWNEEYSAFIGTITNSAGYTRDATEEIQPYIDQVRREDESTKLILGDSVCNQMYNYLQWKNPDYCIVGSNQGITLSGQYLLAKEYLSSHPQATDIYLILIPNSFKASYSTQLGYQYAIIPFIQAGVFEELKPETKELAENTFGEFFLRKEVVGLIDYSRLNRKLALNFLEKQQNPKDNGGELISEITLTYLAEIDKMCKAAGVNFHLIPGPIIDSEDNRNMIVQQCERFKELGLWELVEEYYHCLAFYPEENFFDGVHLGGGEEAIEKIVEEMRKISGKLADLNV